MHEHPTDGMGDPADGQGEERRVPLDDHGIDEENGSSWKETGGVFDPLRSSFRSSYRRGASEGPSGEEVAEALRTLGGALSHMVAGAGNTLKDPEVKQQVQKTTRTFISVIAGVLSGWAAHLRGRLREVEEPEEQSPAEPGPMPADQRDCDDEHPPTDHAPETG